jgi:hypothetical protein
MGLHELLFVEVHVIISCTFNTGEIITVGGNDSRLHAVEIHTAHVLCMVGV